MKYTCVSAVFLILSLGKVYQLDSHHVYIIKTTTAAAWIILKQLTNTFDKEEGKCAPD